MQSFKQLNLVVDMAGCPNRCKHCWLGWMPNKKMNENDDVFLVQLFQPYFEKIAYYSWLREPDFCQDYKNRWKRDCEISINTQPQRFELASFYRLVRDLEYVHFLKSVSVTTVQLTFFGLETFTDAYVSRKGAYQELIKATEILLENGLVPRWQAFINEENKDDVVKLLEVIDKLELQKRCPDFKFFVHPGSCDGENRKLYDIRLTEVPKELIPYCLDYENLKQEKEWCQLLKDEKQNVHLDFTDTLTLNISNQMDVYFNFTHMTPEWKLGNLKTMDISNFLNQLKTRDIPVLKIADNTSISTLIEKYGNQESERLFSQEDYLQYLLNCHIEQEWRKEKWQEL